MKTTRELLGARIRELRKARGLSQEELAEKIGIEQKHVSRIEVGKNYPTIPRLEKIAEALEAPIMLFFDFVHLEDNTEQAANIEDMMKELDKESQKAAFKIIRAILKSFKET